MKDNVSEKQSGGGELPAKKLHDQGLELAFSYWGRQDHLEQFHDLESLLNEIASFIARMRMGS